MNPDELLMNFYAPDWRVGVSALGLLQGMSFHRIFLPLYFLCYGLFDVELLLSLLYQGCGMDSLFIYLGCNFSSDVPWRGCEARLLRLRSTRHAKPSCFRPRHRSPQPSLWLLELFSRTTIPCKLWDFFPQLGQIVLQWRWQTLPIPEITSRDMDQ